MLNNFDWQGLWKVIVTLGPYVIPTVLLYFLDRQRRKADIHKVKTEAQGNMVAAAEKLVTTGGTLISQLERQVVTLDQDYKEACAKLEKVNKQYLAVLEQFEDLSRRHVEIREKADKLNSQLEEKDVQIRNSIKCIRWLLYYFRPLAPKDMKLPKSWEIELWISRADQLGAIKETELNSTPETTA